MKVLLTAEQLNDGVRRMAAEITAARNDASLTIVGVLTGSLVLMADLIRQLAMPLRVDFIQASSYRSGTERGQLTIHPNLRPDIASRHVLLVDDIFDTGHTLVTVLAELAKYRPLSMQTAVLLCKEGRQEVDYQPDYVGFRIPDRFVVGYGLDYEDAYRNLPYVAVLDSDDVASHDS